MPQNITQLRVFISCPGDVEAEKSIVNEVCHELNKELARENIQLRPLYWKSDITPMIMGEGAQAVIDRQLEEFDYDIYVGILWKRFGDTKETDGLTPTEGEFEDARKRYEETGRPIVTFYFKEEEPELTTPYEEQQYQAVKNFREKLKNLGYLGSFENNEQFQRKVEEHLRDIATNFTILTAKKKKHLGITYPEVRGYLRRRVITLTDCSPESTFLWERLAQDTIEIVKQETRVALLGNAGAGKTIELQRIAAYFSNEETPFYPCLRSLNTYVNQPIEDLLPKDWQEVPEAQQLIILDGLDEIEDKNRNDALRQIELFAEQHPDARMLISCRRNFYHPEGEHLSGTLRGFSSFILLDLTGQEIERYTADKLGQKVEQFQAAISRNNLQELLRLPFYLVHLVELFNQGGRLPTGKADIFEQILLARMRHDVEHFRTTRCMTNSDQRTILQTLTRVALGMECLGRNYITDEEFEQLVEDDALRELLSYCTAWKKSDGDTTTWQFEHNTIQEYLAATVLVKQPLETIKEFISVGPEHKKVLPSWVNTVSFLLSLSGDETLLDWLIQNEPDVAVKSEPEKIERERRVTLFKDIFNDHKAKQIWIGRDTFSCSELARFGQSEDIVDFLVEEAQTADHFTTQINAIEVLGGMEVSHTQRRKVRDCLVACTLDEERKEEVRARALLALANLKLNSADVIDRLVLELCGSDNTWIRYALYSLLHTSESLDKHIDVFLEGLHYADPHLRGGEGETRLADEHWHLKKGIEKARQPESIKRMLSYFTAHPEDLDHPYFEESIVQIAVHAAEAYSSDPSIFDLALDLSVALCHRHLDKLAGSFLEFFERTGTRLKAFQELYQREDGRRDLRILAEFTDQRCLEFLASGSFLKFV